MTERITLGLVHTAPALADSFERLAKEIGPDVQLLHVVDSSLLAAAIEDGVTEDLSARTTAHVGYLAGQGADAVLVTCSSIGECADVAADRSDIPVLRVDRPMAVRAVETAAAGRGRVAVLATLSTTLGPTRRLLEAEVDRSGEEISIEATVVEGAAAARAAGELTRHEELIRAAVAELADRCDVVVLAQASMAAALDEAGDGGGADVLSSPLSGLTEAVTIARAHEPG
ncbi:aspartate/glutamate racemase family protein [Georgenia halophila]|uniref:Aspartate/glutamate racemase family protein n=1 Tax=Georgenia halophila TaxID=620889 RepID=A0ABP8L7T9_9MICO